MIKPTAEDIGRKVVYRPHPGADPQEGTLSSLSKLDGFCFVRFRAPNGELTPLNRLEWVAP